MSTPVPRQYDLVVVGAGSGGYVAGIRAAQLGMTVAIRRAKSPLTCVGLTLSGFTTC